MNCKKTTKQHEFNHMKIMMGVVGVLAAAVMSGAVAAPVEKVHPDQKKPLPRVLLIGDSISGGYQKGVKKMLEGKAIVVKNAGNAQHTGTGLEKIDAWLGDSKWDLIHFNWGLWDVAHRNPKSTNFGHLDKVDGKITTPLPQYEKNLRTLVARLKKTGATLVWASTTPVPDGEPGRIKGDEVQYNAVAAKIMKENGIVIDDLHAEVLRLGRPKTNNVHDTGNLSGKVAESIIAALASRDGPDHPAAGRPGRRAEKPRNIDHEVFAPFSFVHFGDPQIGMGGDNVDETRDRFIEAIGSAQERQVELACVAGDLVHHRTEDAYVALEQAWKHFEVPILTVPGNHDIADPATLARFRKRYGRDYGALTWRNCTFLMLNPMLMSADAPWYKPRDATHAAEVRRHWEWLEAAMQNTRDNKRTHVFLLIHVPPFLGKPDEKAGYGNLPLDARKRLLNLARKFGATAILCGHCHSTREISVPKGPPIYTVGGTARTDAGNGYGYRIFHVTKDSFRQKFVQTREIVPATRKPTSGKR